MAPVRSDAHQAPGLTRVIRNVADLAMPYD